jgi:hypothetical protein
VFPTLAEALDDAPAGPRTAKFVELLEAGTIGKLEARPGRMLIPLARLLLAKECAL